MKVEFHDYCEFDLGVRPSDPAKRAAWKAHAKILLDLIRTQLSKQRGRPPGSRQLAPLDEPDLFIWEDGDWQTTYRMAAKGDRIEIIRVVVT